MSCLAELCLNGDLEGTRKMVEENPDLVSNPDVSFSCFCSFFFSFLIIFFFLHSNLALLPLSQQEENTKACLNIFSHLDQSNSGFLSFLLHPFPFLFSYKSFARMKRCIMPVKSKTKI